MFRRRAALVWAACAFLARNEYSAFKVSATPAALSVPASDFLGDDGQWTVFAFDVGTPPQPVNLLVSSSSSQLLVQAANGCPSEIPDCSADRGGLYDPSASTSWHSTGSGGGAITLESNLGYTIEGLYGTEDIGIGSITLNAQTTSQINNITFWVGSVGLHPYDSNSAASNADQQDFITALKSQGHIPSLTFGYTAGASYMFKGVPGSLTLGGYDASRFNENDLLQIKFANDPVHDLMVQIQSITTHANGSLSTLLSSSITAFIDTTVSDIWLPLAACQKFENAFGIQWNSTSQLYYLNNTQQAALKEANPNVTFTLADPAGGASTEMNISFNAFALSAEWPRYPNYPNSIPYFPLRRAVNQSQVTLGRAFFQESYIFVNFENKTFGLSPAVFSTTAPANLISMYPNGSTTQIESSSGTSTPSSGSSSSSSNAATIGGAVGGTVGGVLLLGILGFFLWRRRRRNPQTKTRPFSEKVSALETSNGDAAHDGQVARGVVSPTSKEGELSAGTDREIFEAAALTPRGIGVDEAGKGVSELQGDSAGLASLNSEGHIQRRAELGTSYGGSELQGSDKKADAELMGTPVVKAMEVSTDLPSPRIASFPRDTIPTFAVESSEDGHESRTGTNRESYTDAPEGPVPVNHPVDRSVSAMSQGTPLRAMSPEADGGVGTISPVLGSTSPRSAGSPRIGAVSPGSAGSPRMGAVSPPSRTAQSPSPAPGSPLARNQGRPELTRNPSSMSGI